MGAGKAGELLASIKKKVIYSVSLAWGYSLHAFRGCRLWFDSLMIFCIYFSYTQVKVQSSVSTKKKDQKYPINLELLINKPWTQKHFSVSWIGWSKSPDHGLEQVKQWSRKQAGIREIISMSYFWDCWAHCSHGDWVWSSGRVNHTWCLALLAL